MLLNYYSDFFLSLLQTILTLIITLVTRATDAQIIQAIRDILQFNVAGVPQIHEEMKFEFDPEVSKKRREVYEEVTLSFCHYLKHI